jgi:hypothetical protein
MTQTQVLTAIIALLAILFIGEAMRRGLGRALGAMAVMGTWLGVTLSVLRSFPDRGAGGDAVRNYVVLMSLALFLYFRGNRRPAKKPRPAPRDGSTSPEDRAGMPPNCPSESAQSVQNSGLTQHL